MRRAGFSHWPDAPSPACQLVTRRCVAPLCTPNAASPSASVFRGVHGQLGAGSTVGCLLRLHRRCHASNTWRSSAVNGAGARGIPMFLMYIRNVRLSSLALLRQPLSHGSSPVPDRLVSQADSRDTEALHLPWLRLALLIPELQPFGDLE